jgi:multidrug efflux pump subunit AcrA (membrane-fusion protein)
MTTGAIIAIVVVALIVIALLAFMLPRMRAKAQVQKRERELQTRRDRAAEEQRAEATARERQATEAEQRARIAQKEAEAERAQASLHEERAGLHERGMADHELIDESERDRFAGTSAMSNDRDGDGVDDRQESMTDGRHDSDGRGTVDDDYERGRRDEAVDENNRPARFDRERTVSSESATERTDTPQRY